MRKKPLYKLFLIGLLFFAGCKDRADKETRVTSAFPNGLDARESPMLAELVQAGQLPPLEERLPDNPIVAKHDYAGYEGPGVYGGTWNFIHWATDFYMWRLVGTYSPLIRWNYDASALEPGLAESWEFNADGTELTLHLRKGLRWSDGHPFTSESFGFYYELCLDDRYQFKKSEVTSVLSTPAWCYVNQKPMKVETPDDYTIVMKFAGPNWLVPQWLATGFWWCDVYNIPKHYMKQFHPDYNPDYKDFVEFDKKNIIGKNPDRPSLWPWVLKEISKSSERIVLERNPYYYVVDDNGRQLPYIDEVVSAFVPDQQVRVLKILAGEVSCVFREADIMDMSLYLAGQEKGDYRVLQWTRAGSSYPPIFPNWSDPDPVLRKIIRDKRFRQALSHAIDREKYNRITWCRLREPQAFTICKESWHFNSEEGKKLYEQWRRSYAEFDIDKSNTLLDQMGLTDRDEDGYRLRPDGKRLSLVLDAINASELRYANDAALIVADGWRKLGIEVIIYTPPEIKRLKRQQLGEFTISSWAGGSSMNIFCGYGWVFPNQAVFWHPQVGLWYETGGKKGEAPTGPVKKLIEIFEKMKNEKDLEKRHRLAHQAIRVHIDEGPFVFGTAGRGPALIIAANNFRNVPTDYFQSSWGHCVPATSYSEQYFITEEDK